MVDIFSTVWFAHTADTLDGLVVWLNSLTGRTGRELGLIDQLDRCTRSGQPDRKIVSLVHVYQHVVQDLSLDNDMFWYALVEVELDWR